MFDIKPPSGFFGGIISSVKKVFTRADDRAQGNRSADFRPNRREL